MATHKSKTSDSFKPEVISKVLFTLKEKVDMTWKDLANKTGLDVSTITAIRNGFRRFTADAADKLARGFSLETFELYELLALESVEYEKNKWLQPYENYLHSGDSFHEFVNQVLDNLQNGDEYFIVSSQTPKEMQSSEALFVKGILKAVERGVKFWYIYPKMDLNQNGEGGMDNVSRWLLLWSDAINLDLKFKVWKEQLMARNAELTDKIKQGINGIGVQTQHEGFMFAPFIRYIIIKSLTLQSVSSDNPSERNFTYQSWTEISETHKYEELFVKLNSTATRVLADYCIDAVNREHLQ
jgi:transcriptional regulator with XRE-family HTH domain